MKAEVAPEIDSLRAQVELESAEQRVTTATNQFEKDKLALARIIGLAMDQDFVTTAPLAYHPPTELRKETATEEAFRSRSDLASAKAGVRAAEYVLRANRSERLPTVSVNADYGGAGTNIGSFSQVYTVSGNISLPLYTGGRIRSDIQQAEANRARRQAEYEYLKGRVAYDVRIAWLDMSASDSSVKVAERNKALAERALAQSQDSIRRSGRINVDAVGISLIALASACLELALDRGQIDDWFGSAFISWMIAVAVVGWVAAVIWDMRVDSPAIDFRMLANRNFAIANVLFFLFGFGLFGTTTLIPQMHQSLYGYQAIDAGLVIGPGAFAITLLAPIAAQLAQRQIVEPRVMILFSITTAAAAMLYYSSFTLGTDYSHYALARVQGIGYGFFFVPVNLIAYSQLRPDQNNRASSLTNFSATGVAALESPLSPLWRSDGVSFTRRKLVRPLRLPLSSWIVFVLSDG